MPPIRATKPGMRSLAAPSPGGAAVTAFGLGDVEIRAKHVIRDARKGQ